jgi:hypothetical protein
VAAVLIGVSLVSGLWLVIFPLLAIGQGGMLLLLALVQLCALTLLLNLDLVSGSFFLRHSRLLRLLRLLRLSNLLCLLRLLSLLCLLRLLHLLPSLGLLRLLGLPRLRFLALARFERGALGIVPRLDIDALLRVTLFDVSRVRIGVGAGRRCGRYCRGQRVRSRLRLGNDRRSRRPRHRRPMNDRL